MSPLWTISAVVGSRVPVGSSARKNRGSLASCLAMTTLCFSPPDRSLAMWVVLWVMLTSLSMSMALLMRSSPWTSAGIASMTFSTTVMSPKSANVLWSMMAMCPLTACLRGSSTLRDQKSTARVSVSPPHLQHFAPLMGRSRSPHFLQRLTL